MAMTESIPLWILNLSNHYLHFYFIVINLYLQANLCYIDLDTGMTQLPEELPSFPQKSEFLAEISEILYRYKVPGNHDRFVVF